ncbi:NAD(P)-binding Rossmann-fold containing protein [Glarea lozoyensis ATCC 20868]|uniref:NAD(P)-binding Rossmann-fold containing protein n=1 Tax=Glarea lozoyensis (strain ATCC 20868 / MF5171) TaxID=1116229 RepID=S3D5Q2_GLAL2|nr:NAD(P)-binding Rossmann-fold containing protein [Glarea lozoyensis ATCC 20868]EPE27426.1 NAD(P)-binding Rossmann-fold containing protein [Glarea lozoyensis ATCC 20868]
MSTLPTLAFFGATGLSALTTLTLALKAGHNCRALVRTPQKLLDLLASSAIPSDQISQNLVIITGDIRDPAAVSKTLFSATDEVVDIIISGIGCYPVLRGFKFVNSDPTLCADGITTILSVLSSRPQNNKKPYLITLGTTGISVLGRDVPWLFLPLYKILLESAHEDKKSMESLITSSFVSEKNVLGGYTLVHASLLTNGPLLGRAAVREETEGREWSGEAIGYTISRADLGNWVFEACVGGWDEVKGEGRVVRVTY